MVQLFKFPFWKGVDAAADGVLDLIHFHRKMHRHLPR
jgi:hypothetical protein